MKREVIVNGSPDQLRIEGDQFEYQSVRGSFSITPTDPGSYLVQIGPHTYRVTPGPSAEVSVNGRTLRMEVFDPRAVEAGQGLIVVEAMKMQNEMKSPQAGRVVEVRTQAGATVAAGDILIVVE